MERWRKARALVSFQAFDRNSEEGRSQERYRRAALGTIAAFGVRGLQTLISFMSLPLTLNYLAPERYGLWVVISTTITMFSFADLGIGNGLLNAVADAHGRGDRASAARYVSSAFFALTGIAALVAIVFAAAYPFVPWPRVFNVTSAQAAAEAGPSVAVIVASFVISMPLGVVQRVRMGHQEGFVDSAWMAAGGIVSFIAVLAGIYAHVSLPWLVFAMVGVPALVQVANALVLFARQYPWLRPHWARVERAAVDRVMTTGGYFFILQIAAAVAYQSDALILVQMLGTDAATQYAIPMKLFQLTPMIVGAASAALWPAYGEALARGDRQWARRALLRSMSVAFALSTAVSLFFIVFGRPLITWWLSRKGAPDTSVIPTDLVLVAMGSWAVVGAVSTVLGAFLNGAGILRFQAIAAVLMMIANVFLSIAFTRRLGLSGVVWGSVVSQVVCILIPMWIYLRHWFKYNMSATEAG